MKPNNSPSRVLLLSKDSTLVSNQSGFGDTLLRHIYYAERLEHHAPGSELCIITYSPRNTAKLLPICPSRNLKIFGTASAHRTFFLYDAFSLVRKATDDGWRPTVITTQEPYEDGQLGLWLAKRFRARFIPQLHFDLFSSEWCKEGFFNPFRRSIALHVLKRADTIRVVSREQKRKMIAYLGLAPESIHVIPVGVSFKSTAQGKEACKALIHSALPGHQIVLFAGRLCRPKNMYLWVEVARQILAEGPNIRFLIAGGGPLIKEIKDTVSRKGLKDAFVFLGDVAYDRLPVIYGAADLLLLTSDYEGFGRVIVEAGIAGLPVVSTACSGPEDIVLDGVTGSLCNIGAIDCLAARVLTLLNDGALRDQFGRAATERVQNLFDRKFLADSLVRMWVKS